jgi:hypothetical protein
MRRFFEDPYADVRGEQEARERARVREVEQALRRVIVQRQARVRNREPLLCLCCGERYLPGDVSVCTDCLTIRAGAESAE